MKLQEAAYVAGIIDGEGAICLSRTHVKLDHGFYQRLVPHIRVANTNHILPKYLQSLFGGFITSNDNGGGNRKRLYTWSTSSWRTIIPLLEQIQPFLKIKAEVVTTFLEFYHKRVDRRSLKGLAIRDTKGQFNGHTPTPIPLENLVYYNRLKQLNHRGNSNAT